MAIIRLDTIYQRSCIDMTQHSTIISISVGKGKREFILHKVGARVCRWQRTMHVTCVILFVYENVVYVPSRFMPRGLRQAWTDVWSCGVGFSCLWWGLSVTPVWCLNSHGSTVTLGPHHRQENTAPQDQTPVQACRKPRGMNLLGDRVKM